ncbi:hypothetical protein FHS61_002517 [Altererythrobacter atlanticus]|nr:hypothetical protein [Croceibacterium atlanticum]
MIPGHRYEIEASFRQGNGAIGASKNRVARLRQARARVGKTRFQLPENEIRGVQNRACGDEALVIIVPIHGQIAHSEKYLRHR